MAERLSLLRTVATGVATVALCLALAACNQSGRPRNVATKPAAVATAPRVNAADFGKVIGGDYVVAPGDTLAVVADRNDTSIRSLIDMNNLQPPYALAPGMRLALKPRSQYVVQQGDTVASLAQRYGVSESTLVSVNNLQPPYKVVPGQRLSIPSASEASNLPAMTAAAVPPPTPAGTVSSAPLPAPGAPTPTAPKLLTPVPTPAVSGSGVNAQALPAPATTTPMPPAAATVPKPVATAPLPTPTAPKPVTGTQTVTLPAPIPAQPAPPATKPAAPPPQQPAAAVPDDTETASAAVSGPAAGSGKGPFAWPVQGKVISAFGSSKDGTKNDGINIAAPSGAPVVAAADGIVAYAGNELRGFGNMILIRHDGGYVTAYAHNASLLVKKGDKVKRGQTIARVGATGAVFGPQLHFEIRKGTQPVDPMSFLGG
jgi:murein DD-endopeptidase MepM/ murein hydrolase activator NlpD